MKKRFRLLYYDKGEGFLWFRILGIGLDCRDETIHSLRFSQRYGYRKYLKIGKIRIYYLKYDKKWIKSRYK